MIGVAEILLFWVNKLKNINFGGWIYVRSLTENDLYIWKTNVHVAEKKTVTEV